MKGSKEIDLALKSNFEIKIFFRGLNPLKFDINFSDKIENILFKEKVI